MRKQNAGLSDLKHDAWILPHLGRYRKILAMALTLGLLAVFFAAGLMFTSGWLIAGSAEMPYSVLMLGTPLLCVRVFGAGKPILRYGERLASHDWVLRLTSTLRKQLYRSFDKEGVFFRATHSLGDALGLMAEDIEHIQNLYLRCAFPSVIALGIGVALCVLFGCFSPLAATVCLAFVALELFVVPAVSVWVNGARQTRAKELSEKRYAAHADAILGITDWVLSGRKSDYLAQCKEGQAQINALKAAAHAFDRKRDLAQALIFAAAAVVLTCWAATAFGGAYGGQANWILAFVLGFFPLIDAFAPLSTAALQASEHLGAIRKLNDLPRAESEEEPGAAVSAEQIAAIKRNPRLQLEHASFSYPGEPASLSDVSLAIEPGQRIALLGKSGSGKTTLAHLLRGDLRPCAGRVTVGGADCWQLGDAATQLFSVCQQTTYLFNDTLRNNLLIAHPAATDEEMILALERVGLKPLIDKLPQGLDTLVDEAGLRFSGGERHRIALARMLLQDVPIVILDEPTVSLDPHTEQAVLDTMLDVLEGKTVILITHHLQRVQNLDRVLFLENGRITIDGKPKELERLNERYRTLLELDQGFF